MVIFEPKAGKQRGEEEKGGSPCQTEVSLLTGYFLPC